ncbi:RNA-binding protein [Sulfolobus tengchongensis]|uniref:RNA-binding protein n=1 Tax=Sulfolobus tengchongensis TaxID=207809 RepID=A0AAX4L2N4_9CREN
MKVTQAILSVFVHETEDYNKIVNSIESFFSPLISSSKKNITTAQGHYGNKITIVEYRFDKKTMESFFNMILNKIETTELMLMLTTIDSHWDGSKLYLRFDKQYLIAEGRLVLKDGDDVIKCIISFNTSLENIKEEIKKLVSNRIMHSKL